MKPCDTRSTSKFVMVPSLGLDLDGTIDESPIFFSWLARNWTGKVFIITYRKDQTKAESDLAKYEIEYDELILVNSIEEKAEVIKEKGIGIYFDDQDEMTSGIPKDRTVFKIRNGGNFCYESKKWLYSEKTGKLI